MLEKLKKKKTLIMKINKILNRSDKIIKNIIKFSNNKKMSSQVLRQIKIEKTSSQCTASSHDLKKYQWPALDLESKFYTDPVAVLDFHSLYPSVIIAHNNCFTTCLKRVESIGKEGSFKFGCGSLFLPDKLVKSLYLENDICVAPNGETFELFIFLIRKFLFRFIKNYFEPWFTHFYMKIQEIKIVKFIAHEKKSLSLSKIFSPSSRLAFQKSIVRIEALLKNIVSNTMVVFSEED
ncbi:DNA polymerase zeta catalytic subunit isoform X1 [Brachionus plicatilis]|uniref:DNA-directed DNA polymerase n=1 Tax=Brachionus plicatilis TaxID=10195 RepID=A0A3M7QWF1_BRAPC|nr:DNA polymerase zeta catalytic subunit isoform X1 [Brachionus plicatilis]